MRGLARSQPQYYERLIAADQSRQGDLDGRGNLTERGLIEFIEYFLHTCLDQIQFMGGMLDLQAFETRLAQMLAALSLDESTRYLRAEAAIPLAYLATVDSMDRAQFKAMTGLAARTSDRVLADLLKIGILTSSRPRGPVVCPSSSRRRHRLRRSTRRSRSLSPCSIAPLCSAIRCSAREPFACLRNRERCGWRGLAVRSSLRSRGPWRYTGAIPPRV